MLITIQLKEINVQIVVDFILIVDVVPGKQTRFNMDMPLILPYNFDIIFAMEMIAELVVVDT